MTRFTTQVLRLVLAGALAGSLFVQVVMVPLLARDLDGADAEVLQVRPALLVTIVLGIGTTQVVMVALWRLVTMVRRGTVFSDAAFRYVDVVIAAVGVAAVLMFTLGAILAPGETVAPGVVLLVGGAGAVLVGIALVVVVMRSLLRQAVSRDAEARDLQAELSAVI